MDIREQIALSRVPVTIEHVERSYDRRPKCWHDVTEEQWSSYEWQCQHRILTADALAEVIELLPGEREAIDRLASSFPMAISPHFAALIRPELGRLCPVRMQSVPSLQELNYHKDLSEDPLGEHRHALCQCATQRYPDRALIYTTHECAMRCRHCTRRGRVGKMELISPAMIDEALKNIESQPNIRDVLVSGGDAFALKNSEIGKLLEKLRNISHIDIIRLCTRMVCTQPQRCFDAELLELLQRFAPIYVNTQFNHPNEVTAESAEAIRLLRNHGCILGNQSVLLRGINDKAEILEPLFRWLTREGCRPYYLFLCDIAQGTQHFRTPIQTGLDIMQAFRGRLSGLAIPHYVIDLPDGMGKVDLCPNRIQEISQDGTMVIKNWFDDEVIYQDVMV